MSNYPLTILYDESCPLCKLEIDNLKARNHRALLNFIDVSDENFDGVNYAATREHMMEIIHAMKPDGSLIQGVEVFRLAYSAVGLGWITAATGFPILKNFFDWTYPYIARNRYRLSGRFSGLLFQIAAMRAERRSRACKNGVCDL
jgi:predicted DCC family thiol-disulfide oxidoreductase YuxK